MQAMIEVVAENGYAAATVKHVSARARVSSRTFYELFADMSDCFAAVLDLGLVEATRLISAAFEDAERWEDGVFTCLISVLSHFDAEPVLARVWFVESMAAGSAALEQRERIVAVLRSVIVEHRSDSTSVQPDSVLVAGVMASVLGLIHSHLASRRTEPLIELLGPLMGLITSPYLDKRDVAREIERGKTTARRVVAQNAVAGLTRQLESAADVAAPHAPKLARSRRLRESLFFVGAHPGASNQEIARGIGVKHQTQICQLLADLARERLAVKRSEGPGKRNCWRLTRCGEEVVRILTESVAPESGLVNVADTSASGSSAAKFHSRSHKRSTAPARWGI